MKITLREIPDSGTLNLEHTFDLDELDLSADYISLYEPVSMSAKVSKGVNNVAVDVRIRGVMQFDCARCLKSVKWPFDKSAKFDYELQPNDSYVEIDQDLREEIMLDFPVKPLCKNECLGLCPSCGEDLNDGQCDCQQ